MKKLYLFCLVSNLLFGIVQIYSMHEAEIVQSPTALRSDSDLLSRHETEVHRVATETVFADKHEVEKEKSILSPVEKKSNEQKSFLEEEAMVRQELNKLPEDKRPENISLALKNMQEGQRAFESIEQGKFFDAVKQEMKKTDLRYFEHEYALEINLFNKALNSSDEEMWGLMLNNMLDNHDTNILSHMAEKLGIKYDAEDLLSNDNSELKKLFLSPEFNMYFRLEFTRLKGISHTKYSKFLNIFKASYAKMVVKLQWHLYKKAILDGKTFTSGMITFKDSGDRCFKFLEGYVETISPGYRDQNLLSSIFQKSGYKRMSSHYAGQTALGGKQYGIDLSEDLKKTVSLPARKGHILFGMRENGMTFVKWEDFGTTFNIGRKESDMSLVPHMFNFFHKVGKADTAQEFRESDLKNLKDEFKVIYGEEAYKNLSQADKELIKSQGIAGMKKLLDQLGDKKKLQAFQDAFAKNMPLHDVRTIPYRKGSEVILNFDTHH